MLTLPAVASCIVATLAILVGVAAIAVSSGPGWRALRWFGIAALCAAVYATCALESTLDLAPATRPIFGRVGGAAASLLVGAWFMYFGTLRARSLTRWERWLVGTTVLVAVAWMIPGVCRTSEVFARSVPWLGISYTTTRPTPFGRLTYVLLMLATCVLDARVFRAWRRGEAGALANFLGVSVQLVAGVNDSLAASGAIDAPYVLDIGQFVVVLAVGTTIISRFVSDARALERSSAELRAAQTELVRRERLAALGELSAVVAHEVRNPLTVIFNAVSSLRKEPATGSAATLLDIVDEEAERLKRVVGELLEFARPREPSVDAVRPQQLLVSAVDAAVGGIDDGALGQVDVDPPSEELPHEILGDEQLLRQALINLVTNALQASGRSGNVRVRAAAEGRPPSWVTFTVYDDGAGISKEVADRMFTPFFTTRARGSGLGLAIVKRVAEAHGGDIAWQTGTSPPLARGEGDERGVTFTLRIPVRSGAATPAQGRKSS